MYNNVSFTLWLITLLVTLSVVWEKIVESLTIILIADSLFRPAESHHSSAGSVTAAGWTL